MKHRLSALASLPRISTRRRTRCLALTRSSHNASPWQSASISFQQRGFKVSSCLRKEDPDSRDYSNSNARPAIDLNDNITQEEKDHFAKKLKEDKGKQIRTPWHREGSDVAPVARQRSAGAMTKGMSVCRHAQVASPNRIFRQAAHDAITHAKDDTATYHSGHEFRSQRC